MTYSILVVDDDPMKRHLIGLILGRLDCTVSEAEDGLEALAFLENSVPDLMTLDVMMPGMDGFSVCAKVREAPETAVLPIIMISARADDASIREGLAAGANRYLAQPVKPSSLMEAVNELLPALQK